MPLKGTKPSRLANPVRGSSAPTPTTNSVEINSGPLGLLSNGHPDLDTDQSSSDWANSCFNPEVNIELGIAGIAGNRAQVKKQFSGCTEDQYTMMAVGNFNSYGSTKSCTSYNTTYDNAVIDAYKTYSTASGWAAHSY